ncbi:hypothetical protein IFM89_006758 [Coptis chinensis]|uniref:AAA+ ATPase domain-containing protein n=1 Tax=Coptis chinensis TaxID=261450 RepID=A0A835I9U3_9MAGN|nr:hypothetical protein IFM89_006758 [Coptis chinensis]
MESSKQRTSRTPSSAGRNSQSSLSVGSDSSRTGSKASHPVSFDPNTRFVMGKPEPPTDLPLLPMPSPVLSLDDLSKLVPGVQIPDRNYSGAESNSGIDRRMKSPVIESSPYLPSSAKLKSCDVYIGVHSSKPSLLRFAKWLRAELELEGVTCFAADRSKCKDAVAHSIVERAMDSATIGVVFVTKRSFSNAYSMYELRSFLSRKNLVPIFFDLGAADCLARDIIGRRGEVWERYGGELWKYYGGTEEEWKEVVNALSYMEGWKLEASLNKLRDCISEAIILLGRKLGRRSVVERAKRWMEKAAEEFPFPRNDSFVGRKKELLELELMLFGDLNENGRNECFELQNIQRRRVKNKDGAEMRLGTQTKGKEAVVWKESDVDIEMESNASLPKHFQLSAGKSGSRQTRRGQPTRATYRKGIACVSGERGIGKTELLLEFAYKFSQSYRMVLWVGGEARYVRQNYMNLLYLLEVDVATENQLSLESNKPRNFEELEGEAVRRLRKEFMRDIPFLIVIDNMESEKDWWDAKNIMELLPRFGGETHIVISTRLSHVMNLETLQLSYLSAAESMCLMKGTLRHIPAGEVSALRAIEEKLGRLTFGLALVGRVLSELLIGPQGLLDVIDQTPDQEAIGGADPFFRRHPFLIRLIELCLANIKQVDDIASRMVIASGWFAPAEIPVSLLTLVASSGGLQKQNKGSIWNRCLGAVTRRCFMFQKKWSEEESSNALIRWGLARTVTKQGYIQIHDTIRLYARKRGDTAVAYAMVQAINSKGSLLEHREHIWAACFLLFKFGADPAVINLKALELVCFVKQLALPLATYTFTNFSCCNTALELLRLCTQALEDMEASTFSHYDKKNNKSIFMGSLSTPTKKFNARLYKESTTLKAIIFEIRAKLMLQGGDPDIGQQLCRESISIREVLYGWDHPETIYACNTMGKLIRSQARP